MLFRSPLLLGILYTLVYSAVNLLSISLHLSNLINSCKLSHLGCKCTGRLLILLKFDSPFLWICCSLPNFTIIIKICEEMRSLIDYNSIQRINSFKAFRIPLRRAFLFYILQIYQVFSFEATNPQSLF